MQNKINYSDILTTIKTKADFNSLNKELDKLANSIYELKDVNFESDFIVKALKTDPKEEVLKNIKKELKKVKFMEIILAEVPAENLLEKINSFISSHQNIALDIKIDKKLLAGANVSFEGKFYDGSLKSLLNKHAGL